MAIYTFFFSPPARWGLLDFMSVASSCLVLLLLLLLSSSSSSSSLSSLSSLSSSSSSSSSSNCDPRSTVFSAGPQPRPSTPSEVRQGTLGVDIRGVPCRTSTTTIHAQCSLPDLNREYPRQVFPAGPHVGRYGTKNVQKKVRKNVGKNVRRYTRRYAR